MATEYFQSALFANEMDAAWLNNIRYDKEQDLSETQKAQARNNIGAVAFGSLLKILGHYDTIEALQSNGEQEAGNAYSVGATVPYKLYVFDGLSESWMDYGYIRSQDISSRSIQNVAVSTSAWVQDTTVLAGYSYKAQIALTDSTAECFPIVVFGSEQAFSGNFAPVSFAVAGYVEIFVKEIPTKDISILSVTVIVNGGIGKGITNASASIAAGSIKTADLADDSVTAAKIANKAVTRNTLADEVLVTPIINIGATSTVTQASIGKMLRTTNGQTNYVINFTKNADIPIGATHPIFRNWAKSVKIVFASNCKVALKGQTGYLTAPTLAITDTFTLIAAQKLNSDSDYDYWYVSGDVEVVT